MTRWFTFGSPPARMSLTWHNSTTSPSQKQKGKCITSTNTRAYETVTLVVHAICTLINLFHEHRYAPRMHISLASISFYGISLNSFLNIPDRSRLKQCTNILYKYLHRKKCTNFLSREKIFSVTFPSLFQCRKNPYSST